MRVLTQLKTQGLCCLAVDGWTDHQSFASLAFTAVCPLRGAFLWKFDRLWERETGECISDEIMKVIDSLREEGIRVAGVVADNASNMQKGIALADIKVPEGVLKINC